MYTFQFIRVGIHGTCYNRKGKGAFTKRFKTLSEAAKYVTSSKDIVFAGPLNNITRKENRILQAKIASINKKQTQEYIKQLAADTRERLINYGFTVAYDTDDIKQVDRIRQQKTQR